MLCSFLFDIKKIHDQILELGEGKTFKMLNKTKIFAAVVSLGFLLGGANAISAQDNKNDKNKPESIKVSKDEENALKKIEKAKTLDEKMQLIAEFNKKYPQSPARGQVVRFAAAEITKLKDDAQLIQRSENYLTVFTQPEDADLVLPYMVYSYLELKKSKEAFDAGQKYLARQPQDVITRLRLTLEGTNQIRAGNKEYAAQTRDYATKAIEVIEAGNKPADLTDAEWAEYKTKWLPQFYQSLAAVDLAGGDKAKAKANLEKAVALDQKDVNSWLMLGTMLDDDYREVAAKFNAASGSAERDALLKQANEKMDATMEIQARIIALTDANPDAKQINQEIRQNLETYYKYRHKNTDGLQALIDKYKK